MPPTPHVWGGHLCFERSDALVKLLDRLDQRCESTPRTRPSAPLLVGCDQLREHLLHFLSDDAHAGLLLGIVGCVLAPFPGDSPQSSDSLCGFVVAFYDQLLGSVRITSRLAKTPVRGWILCLRFSSDHL